MTAAVTPSLRERVYVVIFEHGTPGGRAFDVALLWAVVFSVLAVVLESVVEIRAEAGAALRVIEWGFTALFSLEYLARIYSARVRRAYVCSFFGIVDLIAVLPTFLSLVVAGAQGLLVVRILRLLRVFRVLKLVNHHGEANALLAALRASLPKITVFVATVLTTVVIIGSAMYVIEGPAHGFSNIPHSMYWAIVTVTTVGYGDIAPETPVGRSLAAALMIMGYGLIAVPTGIVSAEMVRATTRDGRAPRCHGCDAGDHASDARWCRRCGAALGVDHVDPTA